MAMVRVIFVYRVDFCKNVERYFNYSVQAPGLMGLTWQIALQIFITAHVVTRMNKYRFFYAVIGLVLMIGLAAACAADVGDKANLALEPCRLSGGVVGRCGRLAVYEDREAQSGRTIDLNIAVIPATGSIPAPDPLFMLAGGPGQAATEAFPLLIPLLEAINRERDIVLVDQRGTGQSNGLPCENLQDVSLNTELTDEEALALVNECRETLVEQADLSLYTTDVAMADLDAVRAALGYEQINLYGGSYGTRAAQAYMRLFPDRVRSAVLDAVVGPELVLFLQMPRDGQQAMELLFERCAADPACQEQFPNLRAEFEGLLGQLAEPAEMEVIHPLTNEPIELTLERDVFTQIIFNLLYSPDFVALLPLLIHEAHESGDFGPLVAQGLAFSEGMALDTGLLYAVTCSEDAPLIDEEEAAALQAETYFPLQAENFVKICEDWPRANIAADFRQPLQSDIPVLLLSGEADPVTPPQYAEQVAETLPNSRHIVLSGFGHTVLAAGCMPQVVARFLDAASVGELDTSCLDAARPPAFFINFAGPHP
jgi:pimeloyl-ACP methyl ester carboxylesterase